MASARASSACIRRNRKRPLGCEKELEVDFDDKEGLSRLVGMEEQRGDPRGEDIMGNKESNKKCEEICIFEEKNF